MLTLKDPGEGFMGTVLKEIFNNPIVAGVIAIAIASTAVGLKIRVWEYAAWLRQKPRFNVEKIKPQDFAGAAGPPDEET
jgi:hypothetical protein